MAEFPALVIAGAVSPPFRPLTEAEDEALVVQINASGARTVWVGLKLPRPEKNGCWRTAAGCRRGLKVAAPRGQRAQALVETPLGDGHAVGHRRGNCCLGGGGFPDALSRRLQQEFDFDRFIRELDGAACGSVKHAGFEKCGDISVNGLHIPAHPTSRLAYRDRAHPAK